jgi:membrane protein CcdC involved in cytochrome C biogenesis
MAPSNEPSIIVSILVAALIGWRLYARIRRSLTRQRFTALRPWLTLCAYALLMVALLINPAARASVLWLLLPFVLGIALGLYGLRATKFEVTDAGLFYTPSMHLGIALSTLLIARLIYRLTGLGGAAPTAAAPAVATNPLTLAILGTLAGYYATYAVGLLLWQQRSGRTPRVVPQPALPDDASGRGGP